jgi:hypothetical protein
MKHKHYECILAWAEGKQIQVWSPSMNAWMDWLSERSPSWLNTGQNEHCEYRIKPEIKPDKVRYFSIGRYGAVVIEQWRVALDKPNIKATFDGETRLLKSVEMV